MLHVLEQLETYATAGSALDPVAEAAKAAFKIRKRFGKLRKLDVVTAERYEVKTVKRVAVDALVKLVDHVAGTTIAGPSRAQREGGLFAMLAPRFPAAAEEPNDSARESEDADDDEHAVHE
jgi:hypothetical protein